MRKSNFFYSAIFLIVIGIIFKNWFLSLSIIGGDWPFFSQQQINNFPLFPPAWSSLHGNGLGGTIVVYALDSYLYFIGSFFSHILHIPWSIVSKIFWFFAFLCIGIFSTRKLLISLFPKLLLPYQILGIIIYIMNSYILLLLSGGQMGISLSYSIAPLVLVSFIKIVDLRSSLIAGLFFAIEVLFDFRIAYITIIAVGFSWLFLLQTGKQIFRQIVIVFILPIFITILLHSFWIIPFLLAGNSSIDNLGNIYITKGAVTFFSFAKLENSLSLLHPNWPENIFGKVYFMKEAFLLLPILAYSSLLFLNKFAQKKIILFFTFLGLLGAFLSKGANDPFGGVYLWMFDHVPGFVMFRDPTKWYALIAVSYSVLIPFTVWKAYEWLKKRRKFSAFHFQNIFLLFIFLSLLLLIRPALFGQLGGTFIHRDVPIEYINLKDKLNNDSQFYRTLWVPRQNRFTFYSTIHPSIEGEALLSATNAVSFSKDLKSKKMEEYLLALGIKYIIIPYDPYGEIFIEDRKYNQKKRDEYEKVLDGISWIKKVQDGKITIYETKNYKDHFWIVSGKGQVTYKQKFSTFYEVSIKNGKKNDVIVFSENYSPYWKMSIGNKSLIPFKLKNSKLNSFILPKDGSYIITIFYSGEKYYFIGRIVSLISLIFLLCILILRRKNSKI